MFSMQYFINTFFKSWSTHQSSLVTEAEGADLSGLRVLGVWAGCCVFLEVVMVMKQSCRAPETGLAIYALVFALVPDQQNVSKVRDVAGRQPQRLDLGQFPVSGFGWYQRPQSGERCINAVGAISFPGVRSVPRPYFGNGGTDLGGKCHRSAAVPFAAST